MSRHKNPFVGLRPFEAEDSLYYFGRGEQTGELLTYLHRTRFVAVVGSSGCGKSSLVRAGLIPNLEAGFLVQDRDRWHIARMKPGDCPFYNLAHALLRAVGDGGRTADVTALAEAAATRGIHALVERFGPVLQAEDSNLFLLVDQFEEVFRFGLSSRDSAKREEASGFADLLLRLAVQVEVPVYVCLTMRSDYIGDCDAFHGLPEVMNSSQYLVPRLTRPQRRQVIEAPIRLSQASIAPRLVDRLLNESGEYRDDLPVLQHALMRTWDQWQKQGDGAEGPIDTVHYEAIRTMKQALSRHADEALQELSRAERLMAKALFQLLTETDAENRRIRRSAHLNDIAAVTGAPPETLMGIIDKFRQDGRAFLVLSSERPEDNPLVDISHESLMRQWGTLGKWMDKEAESADIYRRLADAAQLYKRGKGGLYTDPALQLALVWRENQTPTAAWANRYQKGFDEVMEFLEKSRFADEKIRKEKRVRDELDRLRQKSLRSTRLITVVITISFLIAAYLAYFAIKRRQETKRQTLEVNYYLARIFDEMAMKALESGQATNDPGSYKDAWLYMTAALRQEIDSRKLHLRPASVGELLTPRVANAALSEQWFSPTAKSHSSTVTAVIYSPEGKTIAVSSWDYTILLWHQEFIQEIGALKGHSREVSGVAFSPDGKTIASGSWDKTIRLWDRDSKQKIASLKGHSGWVTSVAFSPDGKTIASGSRDTTVRLWNRKSKREVAVLNRHSDYVTSVAFSPDGKIIASGSWDKTIRLWDRESKQEIAVLKGHSSYVSSVVFSPDGNIIASGSDDHTIRLWDWESKQEIATLNGHSLPVTGVAFSPDGKTIASGSWDKTIRLWNRHSKQEIAVLKGHTGWVTSIAFNPDGKTIASGSYDNTTRLWDIHIFNLFLKGGKPTPLFKTFSKGALFFWGAELEGFKYKKVDHSSDYDKKFRPLLKEPIPGQTKFEQILQWAKKQVKENR